jgi:hypothetical protein
MQQMGERSATALATRQPLSQTMERDTARRQAELTKAQDTKMTSAIGRIFGY